MCGTDDPVITYIGLKSDGLTEYVMLTDYIAVY